MLRCDVRDLEAPATAAVATAATTATTTAAFATTSLVDRQGATVKLFAVEGADGRVGLVIARHFDERKTPGPSGLTIGNDVDTGHFAELFERLAQNVF